MPPLLIAYLLGVLAAGLEVFFQGAETRPYGKGHPMLSMLAPIYGAWAALALMGRPYGWPYVLCFTLGIGTYLGLRRLFR